MTPSARFQTTIDVLNILISNKLPMDLLIGDYMRSRRYIGSKDRKNIVERLYHIARSHARIAWWIDKHGQAHSARNRVLVHSVFNEGMGVQKLKDICTGQKYAPEILSESEIRWLKSLDGETFHHPDMPDYVRFEVPEEIYLNSLKTRFGDDFEAEAKAMIPSATLDVRVNIFNTTREEAQDSLNKDGVESDPTPYSPWGLRMKEKAFLSKTKALLKGRISIQDEGSQLIALACGVKPRMQVLDYCAGGGGKTLALAAAMQKKGRIVAMDIDPRRLDKSRTRFKKSGLADIIEVRPLSEQRHVKWLRRQKETFDVVLCDVPCSGTGTWRRNPDMRWATYGPSLDELKQTQSDILDKVAKAVKVGGSLVYATCSLLPEENEEQVAAFLERHPEFETKSLPMGIPSETIDDIHCMRLSPYKHQTDGFFAAVLRRK